MLKEIFKVVSWLACMTGGWLIIALSLGMMLGVSKLKVDDLIFVVQVVSIPMMGFGLVGLILTGQVRKDIGRMIDRCKQ